MQTQFAFFMVFEVGNHGDRHQTMKKRAICPDAVRQVKCDIVGSEKTTRGIWDSIDTTLVNRKTKTKLWMPDYLAGALFAEAGWRCCTWMTLLYLTTSPSSFLFSDSFCFCSNSAACCKKKKKRNL